MDSRVSELFGGCCRPAGGGAGGALRGRGGAAPGGGGGGSKAKKKNGRSRGGKASNPPYLPPEAEDGNIEYKTLETRIFIKRSKLEKIWLSEEEKSFLLLAKIFF